MSVFSERVKIELERLNMTQKVLAENSKVAEASLSRYLKGAEPRFDIIQNVAKALGVSANYLLGKDDNPTAEDVYLECRQIAARGRSVLTAEQKTEIIKILLES